MSRLWITQAAVAKCNFANLPPLDITLYTDAATRERDSTHNGNIVYQTPCAVLRPGSVEDIKGMMRFVLSTISK